MEEEGWRRMEEKGIHKVARGLATVPGIEVLKIKNKNKTTTNPAVVTLVIFPRSV